MSFLATLGVAMVAVIVCVSHDTDNGSECVPSAVCDSRANALRIVFGKW